MYYRYELLQLIQQLIYAGPAVLIGISVHEFSHGYISSRLGDPTPRQEGRLTLNPFKHLDLIGTISLLVFHFGWAKPVRVNTACYKNRKRDMILVALAGPASNFITAFVFMFLYGAFIKTAGWEAGNSSYIGIVLYYTATVNVGLGVFNLIPIPPLDGSAVMEELTGAGVSRFYQQIRKYAPIVLVVLLFTGVLSYPLNILDNGILNGFWSVVSRVLNITVMSGGGTIV